MGYMSSAMWPSKLPNKHNRFVNKRQEQRCGGRWLGGGLERKPKGNRPQWRGSGGRRRQNADSDQPGSNDRTQRHRESARESVCERARKKEGCGVRWQWCRLWLLLHGLDLSSSRRRAEEWRRYLLQLFGGGGYRFRPYYRNNHSQECRVTRFLLSSANSRQPALPFLLLM